MADRRLVWALIVLAVIPTIGGFGLYTASLGHLPAGTANLLATLEPITIIIVGTVITVVMMIITVTATV